MPVGRVRALLQRELHLLQFWKSLHVVVEHFLFAEIIQLLIERQLVHAAPNHALAFISTD